MKLTIYRIIPVVLALDVVALLVSGIPRFKHAHTTLDRIVGDIAWFGFLVGVLALIVLALVATTQARRRRRAGSSSA